MRVLTFLFSLLITAGVVALTYFAFVQDIEYMYYMLGSTAISIVLAFMLGHFMYRAHVNKRRAKLAETAEKDAELRIHELETIRLQQESTIEKMSQSTMNMTAPTPAFENGDTQIITVPPENK